MIENMIMLLLVKRLKKGIQMVGVFWSEVYP